MEKTSHLGMAGHYAAMAEFLRRGYNVAIPAVDIGDDIVVIEDADRKTRRVQVKTANFSGGRLKFSNIDLVEPGTFFMLTTWIEDQWHYLFVRQEDLLRARRRAEDAPRTRPGGPLRKDAEVVAVDAQVERTAAGLCLSFYGRQWPANRWLGEDFPELAGGPGSRARTPSPGES